MQEAKFDIGLQALMKRGMARIKKIDFDHPYGRRMAVQAYDLLDYEFDPYDKAVDKIQKEGEEAARAAEEVAEAEVQVEQTYGQLYATCKARLFELKAKPDADTSLYERRMDRGLSLSPSNFEQLGVDRTSSAMHTALNFAKGVLAVDHPVLLRAIDTQAKLETKLEAADSEKAEQVDAMQSLYAAREQAKRAYIAARKLIDAALSLDGSEDSVSQLMPPVSSIYHSTPTSDDEPVVDEEPVEA